MCYVSEELVLLQFWKSKVNTYGYCIKLGSTIKKSRCTAGWQKKTQGKTQRNSCSAYKKGILLSKIQPGTSVNIMYWLYNIKSSWLLITMLRRFRRYHQTRPLDGDETTKGLMTFTFPSDDKKTIFQTSMTRQRRHQ